MGFAVDLGQIYVMKGELKAAANAAAMAAAAQLMGTQGSVDNGNTAAGFTRETASGFGNKYNFNGIPLDGQGNGFLTNETPDPCYTDTLDSAVNDGDCVDGSQARFARVTIQADAPLLFWSFLPLASERKTPIKVQAVAGVSAPLCTVCDTEPLIIQALSTDDTKDFGFTQFSRYTFFFQCTGGSPGVLTGGSDGSIAYQIADRFNPNATVLPDENQQLYRLGAAGMPPAPVSEQFTSTTYSTSCMSVNETLTLWSASTTGIVTRACILQGQVVDQRVTTLVCGFAARFNNSTVADVCSANLDVDPTVFQQDTFTDDVADYAGDYTGNGRRIITVAVVDAFGSLNVLGFRQFLLEPPQADLPFDASDANGRFAAMYIGSPMPVRQGSFSMLANAADSSGQTTCTVTFGPGKVVLHQ